MLSIWWPRACHCLFWGGGVPAFYSLAHTQTHTLSLSIYLSFYLSIFLSFYLSIFLSFYLSIFLSFYLSIFLSFYLSIFPSFLSFYLSIFLSFYLFYLSIYLSVCLSIYLCTYRKRFHFPGSFLGKALRLLKELADPNATEAGLLVKKNSMRCRDTPIGRWLMKKPF